MCVLLQFLSLPLEVYSTAEYSEVIQTKDNSAPITKVGAYTWYIFKAEVIFLIQKAYYASTDRYDETPYYNPADQEDQLYSQLRQESIKAITKDDIE